MKKMNKFLYVIVVFVIMTGYIVAQNDMPQLNGKNVKITREKIGDITVLHFIDPNTGKEIYTKNVTPSPNKAGVTTSSTIKQTINTSTTITEPLSLPTPTLDQPYFKYAAIIIVILIIIAIMIWQFGKDNSEGEKK